MRVLALVACVAAALALAGCSSSEPHSPVDPEEAERSDYVVPALAFGAAAILGIAALGIGLAVRRRRRGRGRATPPSPSGRT